MGNPSQTTSASTWLSNTKSSELAASGSRSRSARENARQPVWNSDTAQQLVLHQREATVGDIAPERPAALARPEHLLQTRLRITHRPGRGGYGSMGSL